MPPRLPRRSRSDCPLDGDDREKALARRRQVFARSRKKAEEVGLIGGREIEGTFMVSLVNFGRSSKGHSGVTTVTLL